MFGVYIKVSILFEEKANILRDHFQMQKSV